jgi:hypothetical protein
MPNRDPSQPPPDASDNWSPGEGQTWRDRPNPRRGFRFTRGSGCENGISAGDGWALKWNGADVTATVVEAARMGINDVSELAATLARTSHEWDNETGQTEAAVYSKKAVFENDRGIPHVWGEWGVHDGPRLRDDGTVDDVSIVDVAMFLEFGTIYMHPRPWLYPVWDHTKHLLGPAIALHYRELSAVGGVKYYRGGNPLNTGQFTSPGSFT